MKKRRDQATNRARRVTAAVEAPLLSERLSAEFIRFIEYHPAKCLRRNLQKMLLEFLMHESATDSLYLKDLLYDFDGLFDLIDAIETDDALMKISIESS